MTSWAKTNNLKIPYHDEKLDGCISKPNFGVSDLILSYLGLALKVILSRFLNVYSHVL